MRERKKSVDLQVKKKKHASRHPPMPQRRPVVQSLPVVLCAGDDRPPPRERLADGPASPACLAAACMLLDKDYSSHIAQHALGPLLVGQW